VTDFPIPEEVRRELEQRSNCRCGHYHPPREVGDQAPCPAPGCPCRRYRPAKADAVLDQLDDVRAEPLPDPDRDTEGIAHRDAHPTERRAAQMVTPRTGSQRRLVLDAIGFSTDGLTDEEVAMFPGVADTAHRTRRNELVRDGWVQDSGRVRATQSGSPSIVWELTPRGRDAFHKTRVRSAP
jgi:hypothetical protein